MKVFISYRHDDSAGHAGRVHDRLVQSFGRDLLFMDVDTIPLGVDFIKVLREEVARTVSDPDEIDAEIRALCTAFIASGGSLEP